jgi:hypothetical protein
MVKVNGLICQELADGHFGIFWNLIPKRAASVQGPQSALFSPFVSAGDPETGHSEVLSLAKEE